jgi:hypothetical protein
MPPTELHTGQPVEELIAHDHRVVLRLVERARGRADDRADGRADDRADDRADEGDAR